MPKPTYTPTAKPTSLNDNIIDDEVIAAILKTDLAKQPQWRIFKMLIDNGKVPLVFHEFHRILDFRIQNAIRESGVFDAGKQIPDEEIKRLSMVKEDLARTY